MADKCASTAACYYHVKALTTVTEALHTFYNSFGPPTDSFKILLNIFFRAHFLNSCSGYGL